MKNAIATELTLPFDFVHAATMYRLAVAALDSDATDRLKAESLRNLAQRLRFAWLNQQDEKYVTFWVPAR